LAARYVFSILAYTALNQFVAFSFPYIFTLNSPVNERAFGLIARDAMLPVTFQRLLLLTRTAWRMTFRSRSTGDIRETSREYKPYCYGKKTHQIMGLIDRTQKGRSIGFLTFSFFIAEGRRPRNDTPAPSISVCLLLMSCTLPDSCLSSR